MGRGSGRFPLQHTHTAGGEPITPTKGTTMAGFETVGAEFEEGEESNQECDVEEPRSEWDEGDSTEGAQLAVSSPTMSEAGIHEPDLGEMYLKCPRWGAV